jgi:hypothetical protein
MELNTLAFGPGMEARDRGHPQLDNAMQETRATRPLNEPILGDIRCYNWCMEEL